jgi:hypothetical protein
MEDYVRRSEYDRLRSATDSIHADLTRHAADLTVAIQRAVRELDAEHQPDWASEQAREAGKDPVGCVMCWPKGGSWPCTSKLIADDLRTAVSGS